VISGTVSQTLPVRCISQFPSFLLLILPDAKNVGEIEQKIAGILIPHQHREPNVSRFIKFLSPFPLFPPV
jgi:hypothetical protein